MTVPDAIRHRAPRVEPSRDGFLDLLRAIATVRVLLWHAYGAPLLTWVVAAIPTMFFVTGQLVARSARQRPIRAVIGRRLLRIALPLWVFGGVVWVAMASQAAQSGAPLSVRRLLTWAVPVVDPVGTSWEGGWLASPLWYLRVLLWVLVAAPALLVAARCWPRASLFAGCGAVFAFDWLVRTGAWTPDAAPRLWWYLADFALYGTFFVAGAGGIPGGRRSHMLLAAGAGAAAAVWWWRIGVPGGVVNDSHGAHLFVGAFWLLGFLTIRDMLTSFAERPAVAAATRAFSRRALTVYLWHTAAIVVAIGLLDALPMLGGGWRTAVYPLIVIGVIVAAVMLFGPVEDIAAHRASGRVRSTRSHRWPVASGGVVTAAALVLSHSPPAVATVHRPRVPSQPPPIEREIDLIVADDLPASPNQLRPVLDRLLDEWAAANDVPGATAGLLTPSGWQWTHAYGRWTDDGALVRVTDRFETMSITKMLTAWLVLRAVSEGTFALDAPVSLPGALDGVGDVSLRHLLAHTSGIADYRDTPEGQRAAASRAALSPSEAVEASLRMPRLFPPGTAVAYSNTNSVLAAMALESRVGPPFDDLAGEALRHLGLDDSTVTPPDAHSVNHGSGGLVSTVPDLLALVQAILVTGDGLDGHILREMRDPDPSVAVGLGTIGLCPCHESGGAVRFGLVGHYGGSTVAAVAPGTEIVVVLNTSESLWRDDGFLSVVDAFLLRIANLAAASLGPADRAAR